MGTAAVGPDRRLAGRAAEQKLLASALEGTAGGHPCAVVVHGEAGVGKTRLVREVCEGLGDETEVLWGSCVHFGEASVPFAPVIGALQAWLARTDAATRAEVLAGAGDLAVLLPAMGLGDTPTGQPGRLLPLIDLVVNRLADRHRVVVVIDDLHWADSTSLDVLAYLITGFREQRIALLATCRDEHRGEGHPLHGWLADMRRMPLFTEIHLDRLDLAGTEAQLEGLLGRTTDVGFAAQVHERSGGNPYLTELMVHGLSGTEADLPATAPAALRDALLASWHGLSAPARQATRVLAVSGRPTEFAVLTEVVAKHGVDPAQLPGCLTEAQDHGVLRPDDEGRQWFRHPLLAEVLYDTMPPGEAARVHATYIGGLESLPDELRGSAAADLAVHNERAGQTDESFQWSLMAADHAAGLHASAEEAINLERACSLWNAVSLDVRGTPAEHVDLLFRASQACERAGRIDAAIAQLEQALSLVKRDREPLLASTLLGALSEYRWERSAPGTAIVKEILEAVELTEPFHDSSQRAHALASLADAEMWDGMHPEAASHAEEAVQVARRSGAQVALAGALNVRASVHFSLDDVESSMKDAAEADRLARLCGDSAQLERAANWRVLGLLKFGLVHEATDVALTAFEDVLRAGSAHYGYYLASLAAEGMLFSGRWPECRDLLREALSARCGTIPGAAVRLVAAQLAVRLGSLAEARQHLDRALELISVDFPGLRMRISLAGAEVFVATGEPRKALEWIRARLAPEGMPGVYDDHLLVALANAAAELAVAGRDTGDTDSVARAVSTLDAVLGRWPRGPFKAGPDVDIQAMHAALFDAEVARCRGQSDEAARWEQAIEKCSAAGAPWHAAVSRLRCANALIATGSAGSDVSELLRQAHRTSVELGARPLQEQVESLARMARVTLREPVPIADTPRPPAALAGLTAREREILAFLVAGRSNGEIAKELVISDKTVSVHVSNILRKTGTSTRVEAAAIAERLAVHRDS
ncbi:helix-turn-helix transcriptional regulator [Kribbella caucasensis]|uniref:helix-turn-helix transcriptional regulator n=1 Tax=Kribbella caucasensis TaxID=2512215 RepID=UPI00141526B6|nr:LuxR family transcriptional regulator [Kribbella sp. VKM Ac-2527]